MSSPTTTPGWCSLPSTVSVGIISAKVAAPFEKKMSTEAPPALLPSGPGQRLHQRQLHRRLPQAERLHRHAGAAARDAERLLEDGVGAAIQHHRHDDATGGEVSGEAGLDCRMKKHIF